MGASSAMIFTGTVLFSVLLLCVVAVVLGPVFFNIFLCCFTTTPTALGAAYGTAKSGTGIAAMGVMRPDLIMKSVIPVVMAGIIAIYGLVVAVLIASRGMWRIASQRV